MKLYTAVPSQRISTILLTGLLCSYDANNLSERNLDIITGNTLSMNEKESVLELLKEEPVFSESNPLYIYASTTLRNSVEWSKYISLQSKQSCFILSYESPENCDVVPDTESPDNNPRDVKFFRGWIEPSNLSIVSATMYINSYLDCETITTISFQELEDNAKSMEDIYGLTLSLIEDMPRHNMADKLSSEDEYIYIVTTKAGYRIAKEINKINGEIVAFINATMEEVRKHSKSIHAAYYKENAIRWYDAVNKLTNNEAVLLKGRVNSSMLKNNTTGLNAQFCEFKIPASLPIKNFEVVDVEREI